MDALNVAMRCYPAMWAQDVRKLHEASNTIHDAKKQAEPNHGFGYAHAVRAVSDLRAYVTGVDDVRVFDRLIQDAWDAGVSEINQKAFEAESDARKGGG